MATLLKHVNRKEWRAWAIEFMRRGLWLGDEIDVHGPHDSSGKMWGDAYARIDGAQQSEPEPECSFRAVADPNKYLPARVQIRNKDDNQQVFQLLKTSDLTRQARRWLPVARRTLKKLREG